MLNRSGGGGGGSGGGAPAIVAARAADEEPDEAAQMLYHHPQQDGPDAMAGHLANGSSGHTFAEQARGHSSSPRRIPLFERASARWWNPQFASPTLEGQYWKCSFPLLRDRFRSGLVYILLNCLLWLLYLRVGGHDQGHHWLGSLLLALVSAGILWFTTFSLHYQRFYLPTSFLCTFIVCLVTLLTFSSQEPFMGPIATMTTSIQVVLLVYTVIPLPLYLCILIGACYSGLFELLSETRAPEEFYVRAGTKLALHGCIHLLGVHLYILTQVRQRKTFLKVGQSLLARKDLELETQFKDHMIQSVMPKKVADELLKETSELRRPSTSIEGNCRTSNATTTAGRSSAAESTAGIVATAGPAGALLSGANAPNPPLQPLQQQQQRGSGGMNSAPNVRKFRPFTMNLMSDVSILFADIAGFTKMSANKSADELVVLLNELFGKFDYLCGKCGLEKISTLGDCYYCVAGCPEPRPDHAKCCVEMGLAMILAIRQFDLDRGESVNMRVGIHTGKVMCGMVGTKRFKFDVFSNDVNLANEMESTGIAGRVHISEVTASFLNDQYILEPGPLHAGLKTYFIAGRSNAFEATSITAFANISDSDSMRGGEHIVGGGGAASEGNAFGQKLSFRKKLAGKLRTIQSASLPISRQTTNSTNGPGGTGGGGGGHNGSLRLKLLGNKKHTCLSAHVLDQQTSEAAQALSAQLPDEPNRKSASLQALANNNSVPTTTQNESSATNASAPISAIPATGTMLPDEKSWSIAERIGGKISMDLANGSTNSGGRGSRSSGMQDAGSEPHSVGGLDHLSHHHHNASLSRFDTENRDFDQRLAQVIHNADGTFAKGFWMHPSSVNRFTLRFTAKDLEEEYRAHFVAESSERHLAPKTGLAKHHQLEKGARLASSATPEDSKRSGGGGGIRYSGVFIDIVVSAMMFIVPATVMFLGIEQPSVPFVVYCLAASTFLLAVVGLIGIPLLSRRSILPFVNAYGPRHFLGCLLIALPVGVALFNIPTCMARDSPSLLCIADSSINQRLLYSYVFLVAIYAHCNFSQLGAWPKTVQAVLTAVVFLCTTWWCQHNLDILREQQGSSVDPRCNGTQPRWATGEFGSPLYLWELVLDIVLASILVAFLNYQRENWERMSFYGDVQAKRDTVKMQLVRDQADWLLTNIIPQHAVESLKMNTKYSENHNMTAVLFASITNWNEMYEENFEGGREFLRVLNEVIGDFDDLLDRAEFTHVDKVKTIGPCYMAAAGLNPAKRRLSLHPYEHLYQLVEFALAIQNTLAFFNQDLLNFEFNLKLGLNVGPVTAGVIGTTKLYYDIWGDTVNIASRMYSTGVENRIQVSQHTRDLLIDRYDFEYRDHIDVKGVDGGMDTYLLVGRKGEPPFAEQMGKSEF